MPQVRTIKYLIANLILAALAFGLGRLLVGKPVAPRLVSNSDAPVVEKKVNGQPSAPLITAHPNLSNAVPGPKQLTETLSNLSQKLTCDQAWEKLMETLLALAAVDPKAAIDFALHNLKPPFQDQALSGILDVWAKNDPQSSWGWVKANRADDYRATDAVLMQVAKSQPDTAWQFASELATNKTDAAAGLYVSAMKGMMYEGNFESIARLLDSAILPQKSRESSYGLPGFLASEWARSDPEAASAWALTLPEGSNARRQSMIAVVDSWSQSNPEAALNFASQQPSANPERVTMLTSALNQWFIENPADVAAWVARIPPGTQDHDQFAAALAAAPQIVSSAPETSIAWAQTISDNGLQIDSLTKIFVHWLEVADVPALNYLNNSPALSSTARDEIRNRLHIPASSK